MLFSLLIDALVLLRRKLLRFQHIQQHIQLFLAQRRLLVVVAHGLQIGLLDQFRFFAFVFFHLIPPFRRVSSSANH